ncbi:MAG: choice-of-anchor R domain-containing protein [bacterium]
MKTNLLPLFFVLLIAPWWVANAGLSLDNRFPDPTPGMQVVQRVLSSSSWYATPITTDGSGYTLTEVTAEIEDFNPAGTLFMEVWSVSGSPNYAPLVKIDRLSLVDANYPKVFTGNVSLSADTSYFIVTGS